MSGFSTADDFSFNKGIEGCDDVQKTDLLYIDQNYEINRCADWINENKFICVCLQFPDKLLIDSAQVLLNLEQKVSSKLYILGDTSYGSCCVDEVAAEHVNSDAIIHFGHACLSTSKRLPVLYIFPKSQLDVQEFVTNWKNIFRDVTKEIALFYDVSYYHCIDSLSELLKEYKKIFISHLALSAISSENILGRYFDKKIVHKDCINVYIGSDDQTFFNIIVSYNLQECFRYDSGDFKLSSPLESRWLKRRMYLVEKCKDANTIGILICTLAINGYLEAIKYIQNLCRTWNKKSYIISVGKPNAAKLANFPEIDMFVLISCPENSIYNDREFFKPIITMFEFDLALNSSRTVSEEQKYIVDFSQILPSGIFFKRHDEKKIKNNDVSLITGKIRVLSEDEIVSTSANEKAIGLCSGKEMVALDTALSQRSWQGLEQKLGETLPHLAVPGRYGVPMAYSDKPLEK